MRCKAPLALALALGVIVPSAAETAAAHAPAARRLVALGDIHGAYESLVQVMQASGLIDENLDWAGGDSVLVQTGDVTDRGSGVRPAMDLLMRMQMQAPEAGGEVVVLLGNHELMNLVGEVRDVTPEIMGAFAGEQPRRDLEEAFKEEERAVLERNASWANGSRSERREIREQWIADRADGYADYMRAIGPDGVYGSWLRSLPAAAVVDGILFMHAGISPQLAGWDVERVNDRIRDEIATFDAYREYLRDQRQITSFAHLRDIIGGAARVTRGLDWFMPPTENVLSPPALPSTRLDRIRDQERRFEPLMRIPAWHALAPEGPMWFRGFAQWSEERLQAELPALLESLGVRAVVVGHTPQVSGIKVRARGRVFLIDTGMLTEVYGGSAAVLLFENDTASVIAPDGSQQTLVALPAQVTAASR